MGLTVTSTASSVFTDLFAERDFTAEEAVLSISGSCVATSTDAEQAGVGALAEGRSELITLALWLMAERLKGSESIWSPLIATLPLGTIDSPVLWPSEDRKQLLMGSPCQREADARAQALEQEWSGIAAAIGNDQSRFPPGAFNKEAFVQAVVAVIASAVYLPSAQCFAVIPLASTLPRTGQEGAGVTVDYDASTGGVAIRGLQSIKRGTKLELQDPRPNSELLLVWGLVEDSNPNDCLYIEASLVRSDRLFQAKQEILQSQGLGLKELYPVYQDRMPVQLMAYLRLSRMQNAAELAAANLEKDVVVSPMNEYEVLQLLLAECRDRLTAYGSSLEDEVSLLQSRGLSSRERTACRQRLAEKRILQGALDVVRRRLAPIRGIPTKEGALTGPNSDLADIFKGMEELPQKPAKLISGFLSWARGEQDPEWGDKKQPRRKR
ncbi:hypothetical protein WJX73_000550 [Symbiochloris irregularis]|uniref:Rubisco LSMT substrate-binding domain-containing protein n=1 Tax=Symbiochloris irregularis TaxID=706552 RepID=A0AAW1NQF4_9CHLO